MPSQRQLKKCPMTMVLRQIFGMLFVFSFWSLHNRCYFALIKFLAPFLAKFSRIFWDFYSIGAFDLGAAQDGAPEDHRGPSANPPMSKTTPPIWFVAQSFFPPRMGPRQISIFSSPMTSFQDPKPNRSVPRNFHIRTFRMAHFSSS